MKVFNQLVILALLPISMIPMTNGNVRDISSIENEPTVREHTQKTQDAPQEDSKAFFIPNLLSTNSDLDNDASMWDTYEEGNPTGNCKNLASPSLDGRSLRCSITGGEPYSNIHCYRNLLAEPNSNFFTLSMSFYYQPVSSFNNVGGDSIVQGLEFTMNKWDQGLRYEWAVQWDNVDNGAPKWRYWDPSQPSHWVDLPGISGPVTAEEWHTLMLEGEIIEGKVHYRRFSLDEQEHLLDILVSPVASTDSSKLAVAVQLDGNSKETPYSLMIDHVALASSDVTVATVHSIHQVNPVSNNLDNVKFTAIFSEPVTGVGVDDFTLTTDGTVGASIADVNGSGTTRTITVNTGDGNGTIRLDVKDDDSIKDTSNEPLGGAGNGNGDFIVGEVYDINKLTLVWSDEFNGTSLDTTQWNCEVGGWGWGNQELQYYANCANVSVANGELAITAKKNEVGSFSCWYGNCQYTSARINTKAKHGFKYGRIEARMKLPAGQGLWPAFWMLGENIDPVGWPSCGELDIMEHINNDDITYGTAHWNVGSHAMYGCPYSPIDPTEYHVYDIVWDSNRIIWHVDGNQYCEIYIQKGAGGTEELQNRMFILLNMAVGGNWPKDPDASTQFPASMFVDYVRTYALPTISGNVGVAGATLSYIDGSPKSVKADAHGYYSFPVSYNWSGTVVPSKTAYTFLPASKTYDHVTANQAKQDYEAGIILTAVEEFASIASNDGWVLEKGETVTQGGTKNINGILRVGDDTKNRQYRSLLYFNTSSLPNNAIITKVVLKIMQTNVIGDNPFLTHGDLLADMKKGLFGMDALEITDFQAKGAPRPNVGHLSLADGEPGWYQLALSPANFKHINLDGATQFRLRFAKDDDNDKKADFVSFFSGENSTNSPMLIIEYTTP